MQLQPGQSIGRYSIVSPLGQGGMAVVYKAIDTRLERLVAVKILRMGAFPQDVMDLILKRFEREAKAIAGLSHLHIVQILDYGEHDGAPYLVLEYLPGGTLAQRFEKPIPFQDAIRLLLPVARSLAYAHQAGVIHRDVKPSNILLTQSGEPKLADFGIAKLLEERPGQTLTGTGVGIGTPEYMAPEQGLGKPVDARADIYALAVVLYELVTGVKPYQGDTPMEVVLKHCTEPLPSPGRFVPGLPVELEQVLRRALAKKPEDRYVDMQELASALEQLLLQPGDLKAAILQDVADADATLHELLPTHLDDQGPAPFLTTSYPVNHESIDERGSLKGLTDEGEGAGKNTAPRLLGRPLWMWSLPVIVILLLAGLPKALPLFVKEPDPTRFPTSTVQVVPSRTQLQSATAAPTKTLFPTASETATRTATSTFTPLPTRTPEPSATSTITPTRTPIPRTVTVTIEKASSFILRSIEVYFVSSDKSYYDWDGDYATGKGFGKVSYTGTAGDVNIKVGLYSSGQIVYHNQNFAITENTTFIVSETGIVKAP